MRNSINALLKTVILLICSVIQVFEILFRGISDIFWRLSELLKNVSDRMLNGLDQGKFEADATVEPVTE